MDGIESGLLIISANSQLGPLREIARRWHAYFDSDY